MHKRLFGILASIAVIAAACGGATTSSAPASVAPGTSSAPTTSAAPSGAALAAEQVFRINVGSDPTTLDPNKASSSDSLAMISALQRSLLAFDKDLKVIPSLAAALPEVSADAKTMTFKLKDGIKYSNGDPIVAEDFVYSWRRMVDPRTAADYGYVTCELAGVSKLLGACGADPEPTDAAVIDGLLANVGVKAVDPKTLVVTLDKPATYFQSVLALWFMAPLQKKWIEGPAPFEAANYVSSGPFMLDKWEHGSEIVMKQNPNWTGLKPTLTEIRVSMIKEPAQALAAYENDELDQARPPGAELQRVMSDPVLGPEVIQIPTLNVNYYDFNNGTDPKTLKTLARCTDLKACPTMNKEFRIALTMAVDKVALRQVANAGLGEIANSFVMPGIPGYDKDYNPYPYDVAKAKEHMTKALAEIGVPDAAALGKLKFGFNTGGDHETTVAFLAEAWRTAFGLQTEQIGSAFAVFQDERVLGNFDIDRNGWGADYPHASNQLGLFTCGGGSNASMWCNKDYDGLLAKAAQEADQTKQEELYKQAQRIMYDDAVNIPLRYGFTTWVSKPYVSGLIVTPSDFQLPGDQFYETIQILEH
jgi:oligopeptide transport system substrate-binding protein